MEASDTISRALRHLPVEERVAARDLLGLPQRGGQLRPDGTRRRMYHDGRGAELVAYFHERLAEVARAEAERVEEMSGRVTYVARRARPPSLAGYATSINVDRGTLERWANKYPAFGAAVAIAKTAQESALLDLAASGAIDHRWAQFLLRANHGYSYADRLTLEGGLRLEAVGPRSYMTRIDGPPGRPEDDDD